MEIKELILPMERANLNASGFLTFWTNTIIPNIRLDADGLKIAPGWSGAPLFIDKK